MFLEFNLSEQKRLWEGIEIQICMRSKIAILKQMKVTEQIELFNAIDPESQTKLDFLELLYQAEIQGKFWKQCSE